MGLSICLTSYLLKDTWLVFNLKLLWINLLWTFIHSLFVTMWLHKCSGIQLLAYGNTTEFSWWGYNFAKFTYDKWVKGGVCVCVCVCVLASLWLFYVGNHIICKEGQLWFLLSDLYIFYFLSCLFALERTSGNTLNKCDESGCPCRVLIVGEKHSVFHY